MGQPQVGEQLLLVDRVDGLDRFQFDNHAVIHKQIESKPLFKYHAVVFKAKQLLSLHLPSTPHKIAGKNRFINTFQ